jgi:hypothetical protein
MNTMIIGFECVQICDNFASALGEYQFIVCIFFSLLH